MNNVFSSLPQDIRAEVFEEIVKGKHVRIERILSQGHSSPESGWYDQEENEWVLVLGGVGAIQFEDGEEVVLNEGDCVNIPAHRKHKVLWTKPDEITIWLAVFYC